MSRGPCLCGAIDCPSCGPAQGYDPRCVGDAWDQAIEAQRENALEHVVDTIIWFGEYPHPADKQKRQFDLTEFVDERIEKDELLEFMLAAIGDYSNTGFFSDLRDRFDKRVRTMLIAHLKDSEIVSEKAEEYAAEELAAA